MFFPVSKIFWLIAEPLTLLVLVSRRRRRALFHALGRRRAQARRAGGARAADLPFYADRSRAAAPLENRFPPPPADIAAPTGHHRSRRRPRTEAKSEARGQTILNDDGIRLIAGLQLARRYPNARLIFTGGSGNFFEHEPRGGGGRSKILAGSWRPARPHDFRGEIPQYLGKCAVHARPRQAEAWRDLASRYVGMAYAALDGNFPAARLSCDRLSRRLSHLWR